MAYARLPVTVSGLSELNATKYGPPVFYADRQDPRYQSVHYNIKVCAVEGSGKVGCSGGHAASVVNLRARQEGGAPNYILRTVLCIQPVSTNIERIHLVPNERTY